MLADDREHGGLRPSIFYFNCKMTLMVCSPADLRYIEKVVSVSFQRVLVQNRPADSAAED
jgi:hypothetical protein